MLSGAQPVVAARPDRHHADPYDAGDSAAAGADTVNELTI